MGLSDQQSALNTTEAQRVRALGALRLPPSLHIYIQIKHTCSESIPAAWVTTEAHEAVQLTQITTESHSGLACEHAQATCSRPESSMRGIAGVVSLIRLTARWAVIPAVSKNSSHQGTPR